MNRIHRSRVLLTVAGVLSFFALVAYLISDAEYNQTRHEAALRQQELLRHENEQSIADRAVLHVQFERSIADRPSCIATRTQSSSR